MRIGKGARPHRAGHGRADARRPACRRGRRADAGGADRGADLRAGRGPRPRQEPDAGEPAHHAGNMGSGDRGDPRQLHAEPDVGVQQPERGAAEHEPLRRRQPRHAGHAELVGWTRAERVEGRRQLYGELHQPACRQRCDEFDRQSQLSVGPPGAVRPAIAEELQNRPRTARWCSRTGSRRTSPRSP